MLTAAAVLRSAVGVSSASSLLSKLIEGVIEVENSFLVRLIATQGGGGGGLYSRQSVHIRK